jgi:hypothetical protein
MEAAAVARRDDRMSARGATAFKPLALVVATACMTAVASCGSGHDKADSTKGAAAAYVQQPTKLDSDRDSDFGNSAEEHGRHSSSPAAEYNAVDADRDSDVEAADDDTEHNQLLPSSHPAREPERRAITTLLMRYYSAALAGDGAKGCSLLYSPFAESTPYTLGSGPDAPPYAHGTTCPVVLDGVFKHFHSQLAAEAPKLSVGRVVISERHGLALLDFGPLPEREMSVQREGRVWRLTTVIDQELP